MRPHKFKIEEISSETTGLPASAMEPGNNYTLKIPLGKRFLRPIPWDWVTFAALAGKNALALGLLLWYKAGLKMSATVRLTTGLLQEFSICRSTGYRGLKDLETVNLVSVKRGKGRCPVVTILQAPDA